LKAADLIMNYNHQKLITSIMPKGVGRKVLLGLRKDHGINTGNINGARGVGMYNPLQEEALVSRQKRKC